MANLNQVGQWKECESGDLVAAFKNSAVEQLFFGADQYEYYTECELRVLRKDLKNTISEHEMLRDQNDIDTFQWLRCEQRLEGLKDSLDFLDKTLEQSPRAGVSPLQVAPDGQNATLEA